MQKRAHTTTRAGARDEALMLDRLVETLRLASFRSYLLATVDSMSTLVPDVLALAGSDVPSALQRIRPGHMWPSTTKSGPEHGRLGQRRDRNVRIESRYVKPPASLIGDAVITEGALGDYVEVRIVGGSLDVSLRSEGFELSTHDGTGHVRVPGGLPDTVLTACQGCPLTDVVDHPVLR
ncbi:hypothetical protein ACFSGX_01640 [Sphingomonas arantia]|uniref:Uncharacterized protein n=1 Tax=Sphingomonas arantia TaxID=1460676 RepID=A0ABW4TSJ6_9SPHN